MREVYIAKDPLDATAMQDFLQTHGIPAVVLGEMTFAIIGQGGFGAPTVSVADEDADRARTLRGVRTRHRHVFGNAVAVPGLQRNQRATICCLLALWHDPTKRIGKSTLMGRVLTDEYYASSPVMQAFIKQVVGVVATRSRAEARIEQIRPAFAALLADPTWLPPEFAIPCTDSHMGGGIGSYLFVSARGSVPDSSRPRGPPEDRNSYP